MIDAIQQINAVRRQVGTRTLEAGQARTVTLRQSYDAALEDVWDACTNPERIPRWFLPVTGELRLHGRYQLQGNAGGVIERCDPPTSFAATWEYGSEVTWIEVRLSSLSDGRTQLELEHISHVDDVRWAEFGPGAVGVGWDMGLLGLATHLSSGAPLDPDTSAAWMASDEAKQFATQSSELWCAANIVSGANPAEAQAAAERTTTAYTVPDAPQ